MSFKTGSISFQIFNLKTPWPEVDILSEKLRAAALPPLNTLCEESIHGWAGHRHAQDRDITPESIALGGIDLFHLVQAERRVSAALLRSECAMEEQAVMQAEEKDYLNQQMRSEIKKSVKERLLPEQPPTLKAIEVACPRGAYLYTTGVSEKQSDALVLCLMQTLGLSLDAMDPEAAALILKGVDASRFAPKSFSFEVPDVQSDITVGREFLTWLWYCSEKRGGLMRSAEHGEFAYMVEGPLDFVMEGRGAHETIMKKGQPMLAVETKAALQSGKTLKSAKITFCRGEEVWNFTLDADTFTFKGMKLPQTENFDQVGKFQERMIFLEIFRSVFFELFSSYIEERTSNWDLVANEIKHWVADRPVSS